MSETLDAALKTVLAESSTMLREALDAFARECPGYAKSIEGYLDSENAIKPTEANRKALEYRSAFIHGYRTRILETAEGD